MVEVGKGGEEGQYGDNMAKGEGRGRENAVWR